MFPLKENYKIAEHRGPGSFGSIRKYDIHTGVDIYCDPNSNVYSMGPGIITSILDFTGKNAGSPWWEDTKCVMVYNKESDKTILYGEVMPSDDIKVGYNLQEGDFIGTVKTVLKKDKGVVPSTTMLHMELYQGCVNDCVWWNHGEDRPENLLNVSTIL